MIFTSTEATKLAKERAAFKFSKSACAVLMRMLAATHRGNNPVPDINVLKLRTRIPTVMKWAAVTSVRQADRIIAELSACGVVQIVDRHNGEFSYRVDPNPLLEIRKSADTVKEKIAERNANRAAKAREVYAAQRAAKRELEAERYLPEEWW